MYLDGKKTEDTQEILSDLNIYNKYARYLPKLNRRESWNEICYRVRDMHIKKFPELKEEIKNAFEFVKDKKLLPSMRSLQFAGKPAEINPTRIYNCSFTPCDNYKAFGEIMFLLLGGCGVGISVQQHHIDKLPPIKKPIKNKRYLIGDSIEGWADAVHFLCKAYLRNGQKPIFDYREIRPKGTPLKTAGGKAPGSGPLKICLTKIETIFENKKDGESLTSLECHDIVCHISDAVLSGGIRRAAVISLFTFGDELMMNSKAGDWWEKEPQRGRANNSVVLMRSKIKKKEFFDLWKKVELNKSGEPGFFFTNDKDILCNPCLTGDTVIAVADGRNGITIKDLFLENEENNEILVYSGKRRISSRKNLTKYKVEISKAKVKFSGIKEIIKIHLSDGSSFRCTPDHKLCTSDGRWINAQDSENEQLEKFYSFSDNNTSSSHRMINTITNSFSKQCRMIWEFFNGKKYDKNTSIHHKNKELVLEDNIENLDLISKKDHDTLHGLEKRGKNNSIFKVNHDFTLWNNGRRNILANSKKYNWSEERKQKALDNFLKNNPKPIIPFVDKNVYFNYDLYVEKIEYLNISEEVYDLEVEDNHNFYIITKTNDKRYLNSSGLLVHNCGEIVLKANQFCNLVEVNASNIMSQEDLNERVKVAAFIATLQSSYTDFHFLREIWKKQTEKEALIGVSLTGIADGEILKYNLSEAAEIVKYENKRVAEIIHINPAYRTCTVKPSGNSSVVLRTSSGIHPRYSKYYYRRMRINKTESIYTYFKINAEELLEDDIRDTNLGIIKVPIKSPENSIFRNEDCISFLERIKKVYSEWIGPGHIKGANTNNVSATLSIKDEDWEKVGEWMWNNRSFYNGITVLPYDGGSYVQMPYEECTEKDYLDFIEKIKDVKIDFKDITEFEDLTDLQGEVACGGGGSCEIK